MEGRREFFGRATRGDKEGEENKNRGVIEREGKGVVEGKRKEDVRTRVEEKRRRA